MTANPNSVPPGSGPGPKVRLPWEKPPAADQPAPPAAGTTEPPVRPTGEGASAQTGPTISSRSRAASTGG